MFWKARLLSDRDREITYSIKALKTLRVEDGRVSIDPIEVIGQPGYLEQRAQARALIRTGPEATEDAAVSWQAIERSGIDTFAEQVAIDLGKSREAGLSVDEALIALRHLLTTGELNDGFK